MLPSVTLDSSFDYLINDLKQLSNLYNIHKHKTISGLPILQNK